MRKASTIVLLADKVKGSGFDVMMVRRHAKARSMAGLYAFPGGVMETEDGTVDDTLKAFKRCALRELHEETGCGLSASGHAAAQTTIDYEAEDLLCPFAHWISPAQEKFRYDTWFFATKLANENDVRDIKLTFQASELEDIMWVSPQKALDLHNNPDETFTLPPPTLVTLDYFSNFDCAAKVMNAIDCYRYNPTQSVPVIEPIRKLENENVIGSMWIGSNKIHLPDGVHNLRIFKQKLPMYVGDQYEKDFR